MAQIKLRVQLEPYNGVKFDFIEVDIQNVADIKKVYEAMEATYGKPAARANSNYGAKPTLSPAQIKLINDLGGNPNQEFATTQAVSDYIKSLYKNKPKQESNFSKPNTVANQEPKDVPWLA